MVLANGWVRRGPRDLSSGQTPFKFLPLDVKERKCLNRRGLVNGGHAGDQIADVSDLSTAMACSSLVTGSTPKRLGASLPRDGDHTWERLNPAGVNGFDSHNGGVSAKFSQSILPETNIIPVPCLTGDLGIGIHQRYGFPDDGPRAVGLS